jgi:hypothetical protein
MSAMHPQLLPDLLRRSAMISQYFAALFYDSVEDRYHLLGFHFNSPR